MLKKFDTDRILHLLPTPTDGKLGTIITIKVSITVLERLLNWHVLWFWPRKSVKGSGGRRHWNVVHFCADSPRLKTREVFVQQIPSFSGYIMDALKAEILAIIKFDYIKKK